MAALCVGTEAVVEADRWGCSGLSLGTALMSTSARKKSLHGSASLLWNKAVAHTSF